MLRQLLLLIISSAPLLGCTTLGTKTLYKNSTIERPQKLGFVELDNDSTISKLFPKVDSIFKESIKEAYLKYNTGEIRTVEKYISTTKPDTSLIAEICRREQLDGLIWTKIKFIHVTYSAYFIPVAKNWDTEVAMFLFNKDGSLLLGVSHNTLHGNSYLMPPSADKTIHDGVAGALKRVARELGWVKSTQ